MDHAMERSLAGLGVSALLAVTMIAPVAAQEESPSPTPAAPIPEVVTFGATNEVLRDSFDVPGAWGTVDDESGSIQYNDGALRFLLRQVPNAKWNWLDLGSEAPVLWVRTALDLRAEGGAGGPMCGTPASPPVHLFGIVSTDGGWVVGRTSGSELGVYARGDLPPYIDLTEGGPAIVSLECAVTGTGGDRVAMWVDGVNVADVAIPDAFGPFSSAGLYGEGYEEGFRVVFEEVLAATGDVYFPILRGPGVQLPDAVSSPAASPAPPASPAPTSPEPSPSEVPASPTTEPTEAVESPVPASPAIPPTPSAAASEAPASPTAEPSGAPASPVAEASAVAGGSPEPVASPGESPEPETSPEA
jgi:hypothetical protein